MMVDFGGIEEVGVLLMALVMVMVMVMVMVLSVVVEAGRWVL